MVSGRRAYELCEPARKVGTVSKADFENDGQVRVLVYNGDGHRPMPCPQQNPLAVAGAQVDS
jgi:hypothetical protein